MTRRLALVSAAAFMLMAPAVAAAQSDGRFLAGGTVGLARSWDDESMLGDGLLTEGRIAWAFASKAQLEFDVARMGYERHFESGVATEGRSLFTGVALKYDLTRSRVSPFVLAGVGMNQHRGTRAHPSTPTHETASTDIGYVIGTGFVVRRGRWEIGPEARGYMMMIDDDASAWLMITGGVRASVRF